MFLRSLKIKPKILLLELAYYETNTKDREDIEKLFFDFYGGHTDRHIYCMIRVRGTEVFAPNQSHCNEEIPLMIYSIKIKTKPTMFLVLLHPVRL